MPDSTCPVCGDVVPPKSGRGGPPKRFCSKRCTDRSAELKRNDGVIRGVVCQKCRDAPAETGKRTCVTCQERRRVAWRLKTKYGSTIEWYDETMARQRGRCAVCESVLYPAQGKGLHRFVPRIDHDHVTGAVRGVLCHSCNVAIGLLGDDPDVIARAARYVRNHRQLRLAT